MIPMRSTLALAAAVLALGVAAPSPVTAQTDAQACEQRLLLTAARYWSCLFRARADAAVKAVPVAPSIGPCLERVWRKRKAIYRRYGAACPKDPWVGGVQRFVDLGDTVLDQATGLEWEKKRNFDAKADPADPRDADNVYAWTATRRGKAADGSVFTKFLAALNAPGSCFAQHCDWRLPTFAELQTILVSTEPCASRPCIDPIFGPTATGIYWSGEESAWHPVRAWYIFFLGGLKTTAPKDASHHVRAVRLAR